MKPKIQWIPIWLVFGVLGFVLALPVAGQYREDNAVYLPLIARQTPFSPSISIYGSAYNQANPAPILTLEFYDGITTSVVQTTTVNNRDQYYFLNLPLLESGQTYRVSYYNGQYGNSEELRHLKVWHSFPITDSAEGLVSGGTFRLSNLEMLFPSDQRQVQTPFPFEWRTRVYENRDHFALNFYDLDGNLLYRTPDVGHVSSFQFDPIAVGLARNTPYLWDVMIQNPDGSVGITRDPKRSVTFVEQPPLGIPAGLNGHCGGGSSNQSSSDYNLCHFSWAPVDGATEYFIDGLRSGWISGTSFEDLVLCYVNPVRWRVKARNATAEGVPTEWQSISAPPCIPPG